MIKRIFSENKIGLLLIIAAAGLMIYGQFYSTRFFSGSDTSDWKPNGGAGTGGSAHRFHHK